MKSHTPIASRILKEYQNLYPNLKWDEIKSKYVDSTYMWDAGIVQYKGTKKIGFFAKEYAKKEYDEFTTAYKNLGDKIRPGIYDFGFLQR